MASSETPGGGWGDNPSNDPGERGDSALVGSVLPTWAPGEAASGSVNSEGYDAKYTGDGTSAWDAPRTVGNVPSDGSKLTQSSAKRAPRPSKGYPSVLD